MMANVLQSLDKVMQVEMAVLQEIYLYLFMFLHTKVLNVMDKICIVLFL